MNNCPFDLPLGAEAPDFAEDFGLSGEKREKPIPPGFKQWDGQLIAAPGAYLDVPIEVYHGKECCVGTSTSSTGLKLLSGDKGQRTKGKTPRHFWERSNLNPNRKAIDSDALRMGRAFHDALLLPDIWASAYHRLSEGFSRAAKVKMAVEIAEADAAIAAGLCVVSMDEVARIEAMVAAARADPLLIPYLEGIPEVTLAWQDKETGIWVRSRPDNMRHDRTIGVNVKTDVDASYDGFSRSIAKYGYFQSAALELDGYEAVFGEMPRAYVHPVIEKPGPSWTPGDWIPTAPWVLPQEDIERGRWLNRMALRTLADCLAADRWPGYVTEPEPCGLPGYARHVIDNGGDAADDEITGG